MEVLLSIVALLLLQLIALRTNEIGSAVDEEKLFAVQTPRDPRRQS
jgi:hypothetical protein